MMRVEHGELQTLSILKYFIPQSPNNQPKRQRDQHFPSMYVEPRRTFLGSDENRTERFAYYVPVLNTSKSMPQSDLVWAHV